MAFVSRHQTLFRRGGPRRIERNAELRRKLSGIGDRPQLLSAYVPDSLEDDPSLAAACNDNAFPQINQCAVPQGYFASGGAGLLVHSIGDRTTGLKYGLDGSVTIYIQTRSPGPSQETNWLPAPKGPFALQLRMYWPKPDAFTPELYAPPPVEVAQ